MYHTSSKKKGFLAEIYVRHVKSKIFRILTHTKKKNWIDYLPAIAKSFNQNVNRSTGFKPIDADASNEDQIYHNLHDKAIQSKSPKPEFKVSDY